MIVIINGPLGVGRTEVAWKLIEHFEKAVMLQTLDGLWKEHLAAMDHLRQGIHLRGYAQKNPKQEYKRESFDLFTQMLETLKTLFAVVEKYPELKANQNFLKLQQELVDTEDKIAAARRFFNGNVRDYNNKVQMFPSNIVAGVFGFKDEDFFEVQDDAVRKAVKIAI